jgi:predicted nucleic acid-binding protein
MDATGNVLVDTSVVVDYLRQDPILHQKLDQVEDVYLPLTALGELLYGAHKSQQKGKALTRATPVLPLQTLDDRQANPLEWSRALFCGWWISRLTGSSP